MCGRFALDATEETIAAAFAVGRIDLGKWMPSCNIAPTRKSPVLRQDSEGRRLDLLRWGLVPAWAKDPAVGNRMINARSETVAEKPSYRSAFARRRCVVPASGFFEWRPDREGRQPYLVNSICDDLLAFAGLWETWSGPHHESMSTFTILTRNSDGVLRDLHDRMPVMLDHEGVDAWLSPGTSVSRLENLLGKDGTTDALRCFAVSRRVNSPGCDSPDLLKPVRDSLFPDQ